jgi:hypothetical protein
VAAVNLSKSFEFCAAKAVNFSAAKAQRSRIYEIQGVRSYELLSIEWLDRCCASRTEICQLPDWLNLDQIFELDRW